MLTPRFPREVPPRAESHNASINATSSEAMSRGNKSDRRVLHRARVLIGQGRALWGRATRGRTVRPATASPHDAKYGNETSRGNRDKHECYRMAGVMMTAAPLL